MGNRTKNGASSVVSANVFGEEANGFARSEIAAIDSV